MYEDMEPLFANPVLPLMAIALADDAFQDYGSFEEIEAIPSPADGSLHHLRIKKGHASSTFFSRSYLRMDLQERFMERARSVIRQWIWGISPGTRKILGYMIFEEKPSSKPMVSS